jgi:hypothetical protein
MGADEDASYVIVVSKMRSAVWGMLDLRMVNDMPPVTA